MTLLKTDSFLPLTSAKTGDKNREFRVTVIPQAESPPGFKHLSQAAVEPSGGAAAPPKNCEPRLSLERDGDRISSIRVQCSCGQILDLACIYDEPVKAK